MSNSNVHRASVLKITQGIKEDRISLEAQLRYYTYMLNNIGEVTGTIDRKIEGLLVERRRYVEQFENAPRMIKEIETRLKGLEKKKEVLLLTPRMENVLRLRKQLARMEVEF